MKNTNLILFAILVILGGGAAWYFMNDKKTSLSGYDFDFAVKDTANVGKIFLADADGKTIILTRESTKDWLVNGQFPVRKDAMNNLLSTIASLELQYRLPRNAVKTAIENLAANKIKVEIYDKSNKLIKSYYVGGVTADERGTYMIMDGSNEPYVIHIAGFDGALRIRYFTELLDWRDRLIFHHTPEEIAALSVEYPNNKAHSFKLIREGQAFNVVPFYSITPQKGQNPTKGMVEAYLNNYKSVGAEGFENGHPQTDSIKATIPFCIISLTDLEGKTTQVKFHPIIAYSKYGVLNKDSQGKVNIERYYAEINNGDLLMVQHRVFEKLFWSIEAFFTVKTKPISG